MMPDEYDLWERDALKVAEHQLTNHFNIHGRKGLWREMWFKSREYMIHKRAREIMMNSDTTVREVRKTWWPRRAFGA